LREGGAPLARSSRPTKIFSTAVVVERAHEAVRPDGPLHMWRRRRREYLVRTRPSNRRTATCLQDALSRLLKHKVPLPEAGSRTARAQAAPAFYPSPPASVGSAGLYQERERPPPTLWAPGPFPGPFLPAPTRRQPVALPAVDRRRRRHRGAPDAGARRRGGGRRVAAADLGRRDVGVRRAFSRR
jgi:hypothetical protein